MSAKCQKRTSHFWFLRANSHLWLAMALGPIVGSRSRARCSLIARCIGRYWGRIPYRKFQRCSDVKAREVFRKYCAGRQPFGFRARQRRSALGRWLAWRRLARWWWWLAWRMGRLARRRMGSGLRCGLCPRICLGCRTRLGLGTWLGKSILVRGRSPLRLGACPSLAVRSSGTALSLALLVIPALPAGSLEYQKPAMRRRH